MADLLPEGFSHVCDISSQSNKSSPVLYEHAKVILLYIATVLCMAAFHQVICNRNFSDKCSRTLVAFIGLFSCMTHHMLSEIAFQIK